MKILIIGEYSGFSKNLCRGFNKIGHEACAFNWGDTFKNISTEKGSVKINIDNYRLFGYVIRGSHYIRRFFSYFKLKQIIQNKKNKYDCALIINPVFIKDRSSWFVPFPTIEEVKSMLINKDMIFLSACGNDFIFNSYLPFREKTSDYHRKRFQNNINIDKKLFLRVIDSVKGVIPVMVDYADAYRKFQSAYHYKIFNTIPLPYDCSSYTTTYKKDDRISIFHGVTRNKEKGSDIIMEALSKIYEYFPEKVSVNIASNIPLNEYLLQLNKADIVIDQCYAYSYGMNAIEALSMGKVVLSGNEPNNVKEFGIDYCPIINIQPSVDNIVEELKKLINEPTRIKEIANQSKHYVSLLHNCDNIAYKYVELFESQLIENIN